MTDWHLLSIEQCAAILGVSVGASREEISAARRRLARDVHPDTGGEHGDMVLVNEAFRVLTSIADRRGSESEKRRDDPPDASRNRADGAGRAGGRRRSFRDTPSFVVNALPVEAFEILLVASANLGEVVDEDPPYLLEVLLRDPGPVWCRFELFPDAGSTTVSLSCEVEVGYRVYSPEEIRDLWISTINSTSTAD